jgi:hypothetical protein
MGSPTDRTVVILEENGDCLSVTKVMPDGTMKRSERDLGSPGAAQRACDQMASELVARGFTEAGKPGKAVAKTTSAARVAAGGSPSPPSSKSIPTSPAFDDLEAVPLADDLDDSAESESPLLTRLQTPADPVEEAPSNKAKKAKGKKKKKKGKPGEEPLDKRVLAGVVFAGCLLLGLVGYLVYDVAFKPASLIGTWRGALLEYEIGRPIVRTEYELILDEKKRASMKVEEGDAEIGTYSAKGNRLTLKFKDDEGKASEQVYKINLKTSTLDLLDPETNKLMVQLIRFREEPVIGGKSAAPPPAPKGLAIGDQEIDKAADEKLASVSFSPKDNAFRLRHPAGWTTDTGSRPDNTYSWVSLTHDSAKVQIYADIQGSLMSGSAVQGNYEEGSTSAPVHVAHELYKRTASEEFGDYKESVPVVFKGSQLGEGRISSFTATESGLFGSKLAGYHVTLLTNDRRISILCSCPEQELAANKARFLAVCRSLGR